MPNDAERIDLYVQHRKLPPDTALSSDDYPYITREIAMSLSRALLNSYDPGLGIAVLRIGLGSFMAFGHGLGKLTNFSAYADSFFDPIGFGPTFALSLVVFAEFFCSLAIVVGLYTRLACIPLMVTMAVAGFIAHGSDPFAKKEMALLYLIGFCALFISGPGKVSAQR